MLHTIVGTYENLNQTFSYWYYTIMLSLFKKIPFKIIPYVVRKVIKNRIENETHFRKFRISYDWIKVYFIHIRLIFKIPPMSNALGIVNDFLQSYMISYILSLKCPLNYFFGVITPVQHLKNFFWIFNLIVSFVKHTSKIQFDTKR